MARPTREERRSVLMTRVANQAFTNNPGFLGKLAQRMMQRMAPPLDPDFEAELYEGLE